MLLCLAVFLFSGWQVYHILREYDTAKAQYSQLEQYISTEAPIIPDTPKPEVPVQPEPEPIFTVDFASLAQINPDIAAWLVIEGTEINYPVVQGRDNDYYLNRQFDKSYNSAGCLFLDASNDGSFRDLNSIIYGHYMKNGTMFADLFLYKEQTFYDEHPSALLVTPEGTHTVHFFSGYVSDTTSSAWDREFSTDAYALWLNDLADKSCFSSDVVPSAQDRILTLSTCSYEFQDARFVLHGIISE